MSSYIQLQDISYQLPNGDILFSNISGLFSAKVTALVGRNGVGKSLLAQILSGSVSATQGRVINSDTSYYLSQNYLLDEATTIAELLGIKNILAALSRIAEGYVDEEDFAMVGDRWNIEYEALALLAKWDLDQYTLDSPAFALSGGEQMRIRLAAAFLSSKTTLILDEPSNHLDIFYKAKLWGMIQAWQGQVILISHDPYLLDQVHVIAELTANALIWFQGSFREFRDARKLEKQRALDELVSIKQEEKKRLKVAQKQLERQQKRVAEASRSRAKGNQNQAKILMDAQKNRSDQTSGKMRLKYDQAREAGQARIETARQLVDQTTNIVLHDLVKSVHSSAIVANLNEVQLPFISTDIPPFSSIIESGERIAIVGSNGIGKSLLLKAIAGLIPVIAGTVETHVKTVYLDQHLSTLDLEQSVLAQISKGRTKEEISQLRMQLSQLGLPAEDIEKPSRLLSGGERLKAALALILYGKTPVEFLLLDEPNNHLDLESMEALELLLQQYQGTLIVVSHDMAFLEAISMDAYITLFNGQWERYDEMPVI